MKARPMIFNTEMVKALLDGRKSVTRRPLIIPEGWELKDRKLTKITSSHPKKGKWGALIRQETFDDKYQHDIITAPCFVDDLIYVRETFRLFHHSDECGCSDYCSCPASGTPIYFADVGRDENTWKPSIHMPRRFSRLTLKVTDVRIETISELRKNAEQVAKEGFGSFPQFKHVWRGIYGDCQPNDYVWVIEFDVIKSNVDILMSSDKAAA